MKRYLDIYDRYEAEVLALLPELEAWWAGLLEGDMTLEDRTKRWPFSFCAHPRFVDLYRRYFMEISMRTITLEEEEGDLPEIVITEDMWGQQPEEEDSPEIVFKPHAVLRDHFLVQNPDLIPNFGLFLYVPVGADDQMLITGGDDGNPT